jgi:hypothetical protein
MGETSQVPAWKRLGLKLKYAKDVPPPASQSTPGKEQNRPRKREAPAGLEKSQKRVKTSKNQATDSQSIFLQDVSPNTASERRKSVSFTPDTKFEDGSSAMDLYKVWMDEQKINDPDFASTNPEKALQLIEQSKEDIPSRNPNRVKGPKREKKKKEKKKSAAADVEGPKDETYAHPALEYLLAHHDSPDTWKFNKAKQNFIIKHLFDLRIIPTKYNSALKGYIQGLQGTLVRKRMQDEVTKVREEDEKALDGRENIEETSTTGTKPQDQKHVFEEAIETHRAGKNTIDSPIFTDEAIKSIADLDPKLTDRIVRRVRVEMIDLAANEGEPAQPESNLEKNSVPEEDGQKRTKLNDGSVHKLGRRRKRRTADMESSSSSSSSGSSPGESSDDSDDEESTSSSGSNKDEGEEGDLDDEETSSSSSSSSSSASRSQTGDGPDNVEA